MKNDELPCAAAHAVPWEGRGSRARDLARDATAVVAYARSLGITVDPYRNFACVLPGHAGQQAAMFRDKKTGSLRYGCRCTGGLVLRIAEVEASVVAGTIFATRHKFELAVWYLRAAHRAGLVQIVDVNVPDLPERASARAQTVRAGFVHLIGLRWIEHTSQPVAYTQRFAARWCGLSEWHARCGLQELLDEGVIRRVDSHDTPDAWRPIPLYLPGPGHATSRCPLASGASPHVDDRVGRKGE